MILIIGMKKNPSQSRFYELFGHLDICKGIKPEHMKKGEKPTPNAASMYVLSLSFQGLNTLDVEKFSVSLNSTINVGLEEMKANYNLKFRIEDDALLSFYRLQAEMKRNKQKCLLQLMNTILPLIKL